MLIDHYGLTPTQYALAFSVNAVSFFAASQLNGVLGARFGLRRVVKMAVTGFAVSMVALLAVILLGYQSLYVMAAFLFVGYGFWASSFRQRQCLRLKIMARLPELRLR